MYFLVTKWVMQNLSFKHLKCSACQAWNNILKMTFFRRVQFVTLVIIYQVIRNEMPRCRAEVMKSVE